MKVATVTVKKTSCYTRHPISATLQVLSPDERLEFSFYTFIVVREVGVAQFQP